MKLLISNQHGVIISRYFIWECCLQSDLTWFFTGSLVVLHLMSYPLNLFSDAIWRYIVAELIWRHRQYNAWLNGSLLFSRPYF